VFLCHNNEDKPAIREISQELAGKNIKPWLDEEQIRPGTSWQTALGQQIESIKQPLAEWIAVELSEKYRVPLKIARSWLQNDYLVPLLDGLDEVPTAVQPDCVAAVNDFIDGSHPSRLVVCCRLTEYQWLPKRLKLNGAICLEPFPRRKSSVGSRGWLGR
jgi:TIR domain-containing protein